MPIFLLMLFAVALRIGTGIVIVVLRREAAREEPTPIAGGIRTETAFKPAVLHRPSCWMAVKGRSPLRVASALGLEPVKRCTWWQGLIGDEKLFISPPASGWILIVGSGLPDPAEDIDAAFRLIIDLSRKLGQAQFFVASPVLRQHAWVNAEKGKVLRAYAWAGKTLWNQGAQTRLERELGMKCFDYGEEGPDSYSQPDFIGVNVEKVPLLAAHWSVDPGQIDGNRLETECGLACESLRPV
jgi:hypothetical protein